MNDFKFDEETHIYTLGGVKLPSVTQILRPLYDFSAVHPDVLARAAAYGTAVHRTIELYLKDDLDEDGLDENLRNPLQAFKKWQADDMEQRERLYVIETPQYHEKLKYAGTADLMCSGMVIDIKSRPVNMLTDPIQLAAYDNFGSGKRQRYVLELKQDASYVFTHVNPTIKKSAEAWQKFRYLYDFFKMQQEIELWKTK